MSRRSTETGQVQERANWGTKQVTQDYPPPEPGAHAQVAPEAHESVMEPRRKIEKTSAQDETEAFPDT